MKSKKLNSGYSCGGTDNTAGEHCQLPKIDLNELPREKIESLARATLRAVEEAFKDPAVVADFERWKAERDRTKAKAKPEMNNNDD